MDMQNVSNLQIPEGAVRTIHDKDSRLIWGRVAYNTKYAGNTIQNGVPTPDTPIPVQTVTGEQTVTVTGKNLYNLTSGPTIESGVTGVGTTEYFTMDGAVSGAGGRLVFNECTLPAGTYTATTYCDSGGIVNGGVNFCVYKKSTWTQVTPFAAMRFFSSGIGTSKTATFTLSEETSLWFSAYLNTNVSFKNLKGRFQLEKGSSSTAYEPYQSQSYTISLGSLEFRKIGNYQDGIYKSGDDWYVHRVTNKTAYSSSSGWNLGGAYDGYQGFYAGQYTMVVGRDTPIYTNYFKQVPYEAASQTPPTEECFMINANSSNSTMIFYSRIITSLSELNDYFSATPMSFYFPLKTPVDTQITDATLISQLNAIHGWLTRYGYESTVSGDLPIIIDKTNL